MVPISSCRMHILEWLRASYVISCPLSAIYTWLKNPKNPVDAHWSLFLEIWKLCLDLSWKDVHWLM